eukprot:763776-Hanusia_phi.AAC.1
MHRGMLSSQNTGQKASSNLQPSQWRETAGRLSPHAQKLQGQMPPYVGRNQSQPPQISSSATFVHRKHEVCNVVLVPRPLVKRKQPVTSGAGMLAADMGSRRLNDQSVLWYT